MLTKITKAIEALREVPAEYRSLVLAEVSGVGRKKPGPKPGSTRKPGAKKPGPKPGFKRKQKEGPVKIDKANLDKLAKLAKLKAARTSE